MANILVIRLSAIGDVAMTVPVIYSAAKANPTDSFTVLTQAFLIPVFINRPKNVKVLPDATINTESPAWAIDRLSILTLKIYHMREEANRPDATAEHKARCEQKLAVLMEQKKDLSMALDQLLSDIRDGKKYMKVYKQMKMYNDPALNPVLYGKK